MDSRTHLHLVTCRNEGKMAKHNNFSETDIEGVLTQMQTTANNTDNSVIIVSFTFNEYVICGVSSSRGKGVSV